NERCCGDENDPSRGMTMQGEIDNTAAVRRLYEARGHPEIIRELIASDVRWEVVEGFPHSGVYVGLDEVFDFFTRLFGDFEDWRSQPVMNDWQHERASWKIFTQSQSHSVVTRNPTQKERHI